MRGLSSIAILIIIIFGAAVTAGAQTGLIQCLVSGETPTLRGEGLTERIGDIRLVCTGGDPGEVRFINLVLLLNTSITSNLTGDGETEALLLIDDPLPGVVNKSNEVTYMGQVKGDPGVLPGPAGGPGAPDSGNVYAGTVVDGFDNRVEWNGIPFRPAPLGQVRVLRMVNVRVDTSRFSPTFEQPQPIVAELVATIANAIPIAGARVTPGVVVPSLKVEVNDEFGPFRMRVKETFSDAFKKRIETDATGVPLRQSTPAIPYSTESGFTPEYAGVEAGNPGVADSGTRFVAEFNALPPGVFLKAPSRVLSKAEKDGTGLEVRRVLGFNEDFSGGALLAPDAPTELVPVTDGGQAWVVYEVTARPPYAGVTSSDLIDEFEIPIQVVFAQPTQVGPASVTVSYAPLNPRAVMSGPDPEPRFHNPRGGEVLFPVSGAPTLDYVRFKFTPSDTIPILRDYWPDEPADTDSIAVIAGGEWLSFKPKNSFPTDVIELSVDPTGLADGRHQGALAFRFEGMAEDLQIVPVILDVNPPPVIMVDTDPMLFRTATTDPPPRARNLFLNGQGKWLDFQVSVSTTTGGDWLAVTPADGRTPVNLAVAVDPTGLVAGRYEGTIRIDAAVASNSPQFVPVVLEVHPPLPVFDARGVVNSASFWKGGVSPGEMVTVFGLNVGPAQPAGAEIGPDGRVTTMIGGTRVLFDGVPGPMIAASKMQTTVMTPYNVRGKQSVAIQVERDGWKSAPVSVPVMLTWPGIFSADASGAGQGAILNQDSTLNTPTNPARVGTVVSLFVTGAGETQPAGTDGVINPAAFPPAPLAKLVVRIGGVESPAEFVGGAPGAVAGVIQINVPAPSTPGERVPLQVLFGGRSSQIVYMSITR